VPKHLPVLVCMALLSDPGAHCAAAAPDVIAGTYEIQICKGPCSFARTTNVISKGELVLFAHELQKEDLKRFDGNRFRHLYGEPVNGCFAIAAPGTTAAKLSAQDIGLTSWSKQQGQYRFSTYRSPDAGYVVSVSRTKAGLAGTGASWGVGVAAPDHPTKEYVIARRTGKATISKCVFETAGEHEERRLLADPARNDLFAIHDTYLRELTSVLQSSNLPRDWAMAGWLHRNGDGDGQILRAYQAAPNDSLIRWMTVLVSQASLVPAGGDSSPQASVFQYRELSGTALAQLQRDEPGNALPWLMALRNAVYDRNDAAADAALARLASSEYYDDHAGELLNAQLELYRHHPLPPEYFAAVARLDPGWRLDGQFDGEVAPYYENFYPFTNTPANNFLLLSMESGMHELYAVCAQIAGGTAARKDLCTKAARVLASGARRVDVLEAGAMLLDAMNDFASNDVERARAMAWIQAQFSELRRRLPEAGVEHPVVRDDVAFMDDWVETANEFEAMKRAVARAGRAMQPPESFHLNTAWYGNFERARSSRD